MSDEKFSVDLMSSKNTIDTAIRLGLLVLLVWSCLTIFKPFLAPVVWAIIIAVAVYPLYLKLERLLGGRKKLALVLFTVIALTLLIVVAQLVFDSQTPQVSSKAHALGIATGFVLGFVSTWLENRGRRDA